MHKPASFTVLPDTPGVYFFVTGHTGIHALDEHIPLPDMRILYIGRATSLRNRVRSYFSHDIIDKRGIAIHEMIIEATGIIFIPTTSVLEAIIQESLAIKKHQPRYNVKEKDNRSFAYIVITKEAFPRIGVVRGRELDYYRTTHTLKRLGYTGPLKKIFGPFPQGNLMRDALKIIRKIFPFRDFREHDERYEHFYQQIKLSPDRALPDAEKHYAKTIRRIMLLFQGKTKDVRASLERDMKHAASHEVFEEAQELKKKLLALEHINDIALLKKQSETDVLATYRIEAYDIAHQQGRSMVGVMAVLDRITPNKAEYRKFIIRTVTEKSNDIKALTEILERRFAHTDWDMPKLIVIDGGEVHLDHARKALERLGIMVDTVSVVKDEKHRPKALLGNPSIIAQYQQAILLANNEAHRFAITFLREKERETVKG